MSKTVIVRIIVPQADNPYVANGFVGHYDIQVIDSENSVLWFKGLPFINPVFSYSWTPGNVGALDVFPGAHSSNIYQNVDFPQYIDTDIYKYSLTVSDSDYDRFKFFMEGPEVIDSYTFHPYSSDGIRCTIPPANIFSTYAKEHTNCFRAVATWLKWMGNNFLWNIYADTHYDYRKYSAAKMAGQFRSS